MKPHKIILSLLIIVAATLYSCEEQTIYDINTGDLVGYVYLYDMEGHSVSDKSDVLVTAEGSNPELSVYTDEDGKYYFEDLEAGSYNLIFTKEGYGTHIQRGLLFTGGSEVSSAGYVYISELPDTEITNIEIYELYPEYSYSNALEISGTIENPSEISDPNFMYFLSNDANVSYSNYIYSGDISSGDTSFYVDFVPDTTIFPVGSTIYAIIYPCTKLSYYAYRSFYYDLETGNLIYNDINIDNPSYVVSIVVPEAENY